MCVFGDDGGICILLLADDVFIYFVVISHLKQKQKKHFIFFRRVCAHASITCIFC